MVQVRSGGGVGCNVDGELMKIMGEGGYRGEGGVQSKVSTGTDEGGGNKRHHVKVHERYTGIHQNLRGCTKGPCTD